ncbi:tyrosine-type recombinase/integrase [Capnocytophaga canimorsus]|uniref:tyrosine-type recombinase/integrase n=1 Tax=Capnocytophaga canimorsus TaxID=28188 RepID=UPI0037CDFEF4
MSDFKYQNSQSPIVGFKPAELRIGTDWLIVFYAQNPHTGKLQRFRNRVPKHSNKKERQKFAQKMVETLNEKLYSGWSPFLENSERNELKTIAYSLDFFLKTLEKEAKDSVKRPATVNNWKNFIAIFQKYISENQKNITFISQIDIRICSHFIDCIYLQKNSSVRTYNTRLKQLKALFNFFISKGFLSDNPAKNIKLKTTTEKKRVVLNDKEKQQLQQLKIDDFHFYVFCMTTYYCFIRPAELKKLKVSDVDLQNGFISVSAEISKNRKTENVTIPNIFLEDLKKHIGVANKNDFLFGRKFAPNSIKSNKIQYVWNKIKKKYNFRKEVQFYSLKDTGITDLLNSGIPAVKVQTQARHSDLKITEHYISRSKFADEMIKNADFKTL